MTFTDSTSADTTKFDLDIQVGFLRKSLQLQYWLSKRYLGVLVFALFKRWEFESTEKSHITVDEVLELVGFLAIINQGKRPYKSQNLGKKS